MNITLITPTGDRPEAFALCERYMRRQTKQPMQWLVYDDGKIPTECTMGQEYYYCPEFAGQGSLAKKIFDAFKCGKIKGDAAAIIEDDDWYSKDYLQTQANAMTVHNTDLVGEGCALYYNVARRWWYEHGNMRHASLCQTVIGRKLFPLVADLCMRNHNPFLDVRLWQFAEKKYMYPPLRNKRLLVGIKSMPGRPGYGTGHNKDRNANQDPKLGKLISLIGPHDARVYSQFKA